MWSIQAAESVLKQCHKSTITIDLTPRLAREFLERNHPNNRNLKARHVAFLAGQIRAGRWRETHQGIAFDQDGRLIDGQHRCAAVIDSDCAVRIKVTSGLSHDAMGVVDFAAAPRTLRDAMVLKGRRVTHVELSAATAMMVGLHKGDTTRIAGEVVEAFLDEYGPTIAALAPLGGSRFSKRKPVLGVCGRALVSGVPVGAFMEALATGLPDDDLDVSAALAFRRQLTEMSYTKRMYDEVYLKGAASILRYERQEPTRICRAMASDPFELPDQDRWNAEMRALSRRSTYSS